MAGLFDTFTVAKRGLFVQQGAINTTSHNIANASTEGFSRQRAISETTKPFGGLSRFDTCSVGQVGTGAQISAIQRIRDSFIDYQVRNENGKLGNATVKYNFLYQIENILGEPSPNGTGIEAQFNKFYDAFSTLANTPDKSAARTVAIETASALTDTLNHTATQLEQTISDAQKLLQNNIKDVNSYLDQINTLNKQISGVSAVGQTPNDLMDSRDFLLDKVSKMFGIKIEPKEKETMNVKAEAFNDENANNKIPNLVNASPTDENYVRFSYVKGVSLEKDNAGKLTGNLKIEYYPLGNLNANPKTVTIKGELEDDPLNAGLKLDKLDAATEKSFTELKENLMQNRILIADKNGNLQLKDTNGNVVGLDDAGNTKVINSTDNSVSLYTNGVLKSVTTVNGTVTEYDAAGTKITRVIEGNGTVTEYDNSGAVTKVTDTNGNVTVSGVTKDKDGHTLTLDAGTGKWTYTSGADTIEVSVLDTTSAAGTGGTAAGALDISNVDISKKVFKTYEYDKSLNSVDNKQIKGEIAGNQSVQNIAEGYLKDLDRVAASLAYAVNAIQTGSTDGTNQLTDALIFVNETGTETGITAKTISINKDLKIDDLNCAVTDVDGKRIGKRAQAIANLRNLNMNVSNIANDNDPTAVSLENMTRDEFFKATGLKFDNAGTDKNMNLLASKEGTSISAYYNDIVNTLGVNTRSAKKSTSDQQIILKDLENQRQSVAGVNIDEEMTNLIQFQHAYQANAKMISTIDELLDVVINGLKR